MRKINYVATFFISALLPVVVLAQDTLMINEVRINTSVVKQYLLRSTTAAAIIDSVQLQRQAVVSLVPAMNAVPGIRMEERSPGSYRLSIRGSLLRSPFGVRNVKVYLNEYPLTDAGGNTYLNVVAMNAVQRIEVFKGPDGSLFGANSGGVVCINTIGKKEGAVAELVGGSYGFLKQHFAVAKKTGKHFLNFGESFQQADGYRDHSKFHRLYLQLADDWAYSKNKRLKIFAFYSDVFYQTAGGLTLSQLEADPTQARPATSAVPGAVVQKAAVYNKMLFGGITHNLVINKYIENTTALFISFVNFKNPFITNYETRTEKTYGARSFFSFSRSLTATGNSNLTYVLGAEWQETRSMIGNYENNGGLRGILTASGNIISSQHFAFNRIQLDLNKKLLVEAGLSINYYGYRFRDSTRLQSDFKPEWMPRLAVSYSPLKKISFRVSGSRGYSSPTTAEIRPSDNNIYPELRAETGINMELGLRYFAIGNKLWIDLSVYHYQLKNAIVRQENVAGQEFFVNAGGTNQKGLELQSSYLFLQPSQRKRFIDKLQLSNSITLNNFIFRNYRLVNMDYSGNKLTGVPVCTIVNSLTVETAMGTRLFIRHNYTSSVPLNDANSIYAHPYNLLQISLSHPVLLKKCSLEIYGDMDNLLNQKYSLGNDLNAAGGRFYNAAGKRSFLIGVRIVTVRKISTLKTN
ncbi:MAG: TonB-dependent receptor [Ferruginibacter sp.]